MADIIRINENTWRIEDGQVRFYLLEGSERAALIDTGMDTPNAREIAESLTELPIILINTHADPDHISGNKAFEEFYMSPKEEENYREQHGTGNLIPVVEGDEIELGNRLLTIIDIPGHTPGSIAILDEKNRVLISGDTIQDGNIFMFGKYRNITEYINSLIHLKEFAGLFDEIYPMHGSFPVKPELIDKLLEGAKDIKYGRAAGTEISLFGNTVCHYKFSYASFLGETV